LSLLVILVDLIKTLTSEYDILGCLGAGGSGDAWDSGTAVDDGWDSGTAVDDDAWDSGTAVDDDAWDSGTVEVDSELH